MAVEVAAEVTAGAQVAVVAEVVEEAVEAAAEVGAGLCCFRSKYWRRSSTDYQSRLQGRP